MNCYSHYDMNIFQVVDIIVLMKHNKAFKYRIYPNAEQTILLAKTFGCVRFVYNHFLDQRIKAYEIDDKFISYNSCANSLVSLKEEKDFLKEVDSISLQQALRHLDVAYKNFFRDKRVGFPRFKSKKNNYFSYTTVCVNNNIKFEDGHLTLPKIKAIKVKQHRAVPSDYVLKSVTISKTPSGKYFASILYQFEKEIPTIESKTFLGLDFSMKELYVDSEGKSADYPRYYRNALDKLAKESRKLSKMKKGSQNRNKQRLKVAKLNEHVSNQRKDFLHKQSRQIANAYDCVSVEDLNMKAMSQCLNFGKSVSDNGWGIFTTLLEYKLAESGKQLIKVDKFFPSSQVCSVCGSKNPIKKDLNVRHWVCPDCGAQHDRDINASINIKNEGMRIAFA